jgi:polyisoprenyl-teichoic acid--peptidoglycan teichoic acid transferase
VTDSPTILARTGPRRSPRLAATLSFLWPGLGQWYGDARQRAVVFAVPVAAAALVLIVGLAGGLRQMAIRFIEPDNALAAFLILGLLGVWRLASIGDAARLVAGRAAWRDRRTIGVVAALAAVTVLVHGYLGYVTWTAYEAGNQIFDPGPGTGGNNGSSPSPDSSGIEGDFNATPAATPETANSRITVLITGIDSSESRTHALTDTLIVASVDPVAHTTVLVSFPRDLARFPLYTGGTYSGKINSLMTYARLHPQEFPDGPVNTVANELGYLLGIPVHYYAAVNLEGFVTMVDAVGGVDVVNDRAINDPSYGGWTNGHPVGFTLSAGPHHLDGQTALAYARSRKGAGDNDFTRARRQQQLLVAIEHRLTDPSVLVRLPDLLNAAAATVRTNFPADRADEMLTLADETPDSAITRTVLGPRTYATNPPASESGGLYILVPKMDAIAEFSIRVFGSDSRYATGGSAPGSASRPRPGRSPQ